MLGDMSPGTRDHLVPTSAWHNAFHPRWKNGAGKLRIINTPPAAPLLEADCFDKGEDAMDFIPCILPSFSEGHLSEGCGRSSSVCQVRRVERFQR